MATIIGLGVILVVLYLGLQTWCYEMNRPAMEEATNAARRAEVAAARAAWQATQNV